MSQRKAIHQVNEATPLDEAAMDMIDKFVMDQEKEGDEDEFIQSLEK